VTKKVIDPQPIINELAQRCLKAKGLECSLLGEVIDMLKAAPAVYNAPYLATEEAFKHGYEKGYEAGKPKWIPVTERLPEAGKCVLIYSEKGKVAEGQYTVTQDWAQFRWSATKVKVTHWMPLPEAPKEE
jgi:hypothetical protein